MSSRQTKINRPSSTRASTAPRSRFAPRPFEEEVDSAEADTQPEVQTKRDHPPLRSFNLATMPLYAPPAMQRQEEESDALNFFMPVSSANDTQALEAPAKNLPSFPSNNSSSLYNAPRIELLDFETLYATTRSTPPNGNPCFDIVQLILELGTDLLFRYDDLLRDRHNLYNRRRSDNEPPVFDDRGNNLGSYEGHQARYEQVQRELDQAVERANDNDCDHFDANAVGGDQAERLYQRILTERNRPFPERPDRGGQQGFVVPDWAIEQGVRFVDGVLYIPVTVSSFIFSLLMILVEFFQLSWRSSS